MDRRELVERAGGGDHDAFAVLATALAPRLDAAARLILRDPELARDAVQNALVRAWRDLPGLRDPDRFDAWLHRLLVNSCLDEARRRRRRPIEVEIDPIHEPQAGTDDVRSVADRDQVERALNRLDPERDRVTTLEVADIGSHRDDPATRAADADLLAAIRLLPPDDRALLSLRYVAGFDATEIGVALGITSSGVRSRLSRLVDRLRTEIGDV